MTSLKSKNAKSISAHTTSFLILVMALVLHSAKSAAQDGVDGTAASAASPGAVGTPPNGGDDGTILADYSLDTPEQRLRVFNELFKSATAVQEAQKRTALGVAREMYSAIMTILSETNGGVNNIRVIAPAGAGKTTFVYVISEIYKKVSNGGIVYQMDKGTFDKVAKAHGGGRAAVDVMVRLFAEFSEPRSSIFVDEAHALFTSNQYPDDFKEALLEGKLRMIIASTDKEWALIQKANPAIHRRFIDVWLKDPSYIELKNILNFKLEENRRLVQRQAPHEVLPTVPSRVIDFLARAAVRFGMGKNGITESAVNILLQTFTRARMRLSGFSDNYLVLREQADILNAEIKMLKSEKEVVAILSDKDVLDVADRLGVRDQVDEAARSEQERLKTEGYDQKISELEQRLATVMAELNPLEIAFANRGVLSDQAKALLAKKDQVPAAKVYHTAAGLLKTFNIIFTRNGISATVSDFAGLQKVLNQLTPQQRQGLKGAFDQFKLTQLVEGITRPTADNWNPLLAGQDLSPQDIDTIELLSGKGDAAKQAQVYEAMYRQQRGQSAIASETELARLVSDVNGVSPQVMLEDRNTRVGRIRDNLSEYGLVDAPEAKIVADHLNSSFAQLDAAIANPDVVTKMDRYVLVGNPTDHIAIANMIADGRTVTVQDLRDKSYTHWNNMIGSDAGYTGFKEEGGVLPQFVADHPNGLIVLRVNVAEAKLFDRSDLSGTDKGIIKQIINILETGKLTFGQAKDGALDLTRMTVVVSLEGVGNEFADMTMEQRLEVLKKAGADTNQDLSVETRARVLAELSLDTEQSVEIKELLDVAGSERLIVSVATPEDLLKKYFFEEMKRKANELRREYGVEVEITDATLEEWYSKVRGESDAIKLRGKLESTVSDIFRMVREEFQARRVNTQSRPVVEIGGPITETAADSGRNVAISVDPNSKRHVLRFPSGNAYIEQANNERESLVNKLRAERAAAKANNGTPPAEIVPDSVVVDDSSPTAARDDVPPVARDDGSRAGTTRPIAPPRIETETSVEPAARVSPSPRPTPAGSHAGQRRPPSRTPSPAAAALAQDALPANQPAAVDEDLGTRRVGVGENRGQSVDSVAAAGSRRGGEAVDASKALEVKETLARARAQTQAQRGGGRPIPAPAAPTRSTSRGRGR
jgi:ATP-dependent Clp protease ATP-binding subunit ClpA